MANDFVQTMIDARVDARSLSDFMFYPASEMIARRLAPSIHTLNYYLDYFNGLESLYSQESGTVTVNGVEIKTVRQAMNDAIDDVLLGEYQEGIRADLNAQKLDTGITATAKFGGVARPQSEVNAQTVSIQDFGADTASDDNSAAINSAIQYCLTNNAQLNFPAGVWAYTGNLEGILSIATMGAGVLVRGGSQFTITPKDANTINTIHLSPTGLDSNDGLSPDTPIKTLGALYTAIRHQNQQSKFMGGQWVVSFAAGVYVGALRINFTLNSSYPLKFLGVKDVGNKPTTIIKAEVGKHYCVWADAGNYLVEGIEFQGNGVRDTQYGWLHQGIGITTLTHCHAENIGYGLVVIGKAEMRTRKCTANNCDIAFRGAYNATASIGSPDNDCYATNCGIGAHLTRNTIGHVDYLHCDDSNYAVYLDMASRAHVLGANFKRCTVGVYAEGASEWINNIEYPNNFNTGTADACVVPYEHWNNASESRLYAQYARTQRWLTDDVKEYKLSGVIEATRLARFTSFRNGAPVRMPKDWFFGAKRIDVKAKVTLSGTGSKELMLYVLDDDLTNPTKVINLMTTANAGTFDVHLIITPTKTGQHYDISYIKSGVVVFYSGALALDMTSNDKQLQLYVKHADASDVTKISRLELSFAG